MAGGKRIHRTMITLKSRENGFVIVLTETVTLEECKTLRFQLRDEWAGLDTAFVLVVDVRAFRYFTADAQAMFEEIMEEALAEGVERITVLGVSTAYASLFCEMMVRTDLMPLYQFLDLSYEEDWRGEMEAWLGEPFEEEAVGV